MREKVSVLGAGAFGTAIANLLADNGFNVYLWSYENDLVFQINVEHENKLYLPGFKLNENILVTNDLKQVIQDTNFIFQAIPVKFLRSVLVQVKDYITKDQVFISLSKGIEESTLLFPTQIIESVLENKNKVFALSGPNFAHEIIEKQFTRSVLAGSHDFYSLKISNILKNNYFKIDESTDLIGVQVGGALKNVISLLAGISSGYQLGKNTIAFIVTKAFENASNLIVSLGGQKETIYGLSGFGDLYLSSTSPFGKNFMFGFEIGKLIKSGDFDKDIFFKSKILPEGVNAITPLHELIIKSNLDLYHLDLAYKIIFESFKFIIE